MSLFYSCSSDSLVSSGTYQRAVSEQKNNELPIPHPVYRRSRELGMVPWRAWRRSREWSIERPLNDEVNFISGRSVNSDARPFEQVIVNKWFELKPNRQPNWQMYNSTSNAIALEWLERKWMLRNHVTEDDDEDGVISGEGPDGVELEGRDAADHYYVRRRSSHPLWGYRRKYYLHYGTQWGIFTVACFFFLSASVGCLSTVWCFYTMPPPDEPFFRREKLIVGPDGRSSRALTTTFADPLLMHGSQSCNDRGYIRSLQFFLPFCSGLLKDDDNSCNNQNGQGEGETNVC
ncbi:unnamed protein product [Cyprideis torosa]|uniref:Uncharacterized protein n=1 Tax=Cyprideis torosa TaxID=163714 RepID=A0A7R8WE33_9CRUS|nr:unnamed protein product [Cyprideis torosa]CAG0895285.1 unnamed protein product [Cyprideis torosa]